MGFDAHAASFRVSTSLHSLQVSGCYQLLLQKKCTEPFFLATGMKGTHVAAILKHQCQQLAKEGQHIGLCL